MKKSQKLNLLGLAQQNGFWPTFVAEFAEGPQQKPKNLPEKSCYLFLAGKYLKSPLPPMQVVAAFF
jgi:hypothetical protein